MRSREDNKRFKNIHKGAHAYIACTGPSLNSITELDGIVFGLNRGYLKEDIDYTYFLVADKLIAAQYGHEIERLPATVFTSRGIALEGFINDQYIWEGDGRKRFQTDFTKKIYGGGTVTFVAMQLAYYMGIQTLYLVGCDHYMSHQHAERVSNRVFQVQTQDVDHFHPEYMRPGDNYFTQDISKVEESYSLGRRAFEAAGRKLLNATEGTHLPATIIERIGEIG